MSCSAFGRQLTQVALILALAGLGACSDDTTSAPKKDSMVLKDGPVADKAATGDQGQTADKGTAADTGTTSDKGTTADTATQKDQGSSSDGGSGAATIGPLGGTLKSQDGQFTLIVPAGALSNTTNFSVTQASKLPATTGFTEIGTVTLDTTNQTVSVQTTHNSCNCLGETSPPSMGAAPPAKLLLAFDTLPDTTFTKPATLTISYKKLASGSFIPQYLRLYSKAGACNPAAP